MFEKVADAELLTSLPHSTDVQKKEILLVLYERYKNLVLKVCFYHLADYEAASDVFHDVFIKVIENADSLKNPNLFKSWLMTVTRNLCVDRLRRSSYLKGQEPLSAEIEVSCEERVEDRYIAEMERERILNHLTGCVHKLDPSLLNIFRLRWTGLRAAQILKIVKTDKAELRRSYDRIKSVLEGCMRTKGYKISIEQIIGLGEIDG